MEAVLSAKTSAVCFNKDDFMVNDFSVDKFVSNYRKYVSLETLLADLGVYHRILCSAMIQLLNKDYADFLNLSSNLVGLDKSINILCLPLEKLEDNVKDMKNSLNELLQDAEALFLSYSTTHKKKVLSHRALCVLESLEKLENLMSLPLTDDKIPSDVLERLALDFNSLQFHMRKVSCLKYIENKKGVVQEIADSLKHHLEKLFLQSLSTNDTKCLLRVLRIYALISMEAELEKVFAQVIVRPYMECHITEENIQKYGLSYVYDKALDFITSSRAVLDASRGSKKSTQIVPGFDFLVNSVFPEIVYCFDLITPVHIYAHGNPEKFHQNYVSTMLFLDQFEHACGNQTSVQRLRNHESYARFLSKWNLDVYFQMIFSDVAGKLEKCLLEEGCFIYSKDFSLSKRGNSYLSKACRTLSENVNLCYDEKIFLKPLAHHFFRLNLKLISRFHKSLCSYLKDNEESVDPVDGAVIIRDVEILINEFKKLFEKRVIHYVPRDVVEVAYEESVKSLEGILPLASSVTIQTLTKQCCVHLKLISDIPRLYRKTNREVPCKPSSYVALVFNNLTEFISKTDSILPPKSKRYCLEEVTNGIFVECVIMIKDVLTAIKKMEDSLKILKRARDKNQIAPSGGFTDDDKIRLQLITDIHALEEKSRELELDIDNLKSFKELKDLVNSTEKILPQNF